MKSTLFLIGICLLLCFTACQQEDFPPPYGPPINPNLQYFGYTLVDVGFDDPSDRENKTNYLDEVSDFSNVADLLVLEPSDNIVDRLDAMARVGVTGMIHLNELFFEWVGNGGDLSGSIYALRSDYRERWDTFVTTNDFLNSSSDVHSFYLGEEPTWNGISATDFDAAAAYIKATVPDVPILLIEAFAALDDLVIPNAVDYVGFDHYFIPDPNSDGDFLGEMATLKSKMHPGQQIFLVMDAHHIKFAHGSVGIARQDMDVIARSYYTLANSDTLVAGIIAYHWPNGFEFKSAKGTRGLPDNVLFEHRRIGASITGK